MTAFPLMPSFSGAGKIASVYLTATATSTSSTIVAPADVRSGDLIVLYDAPSYPSGSPSGTPPTGFTTLASVAFGGWSNGIILSAKVADGTEGGTTITGMNGTTSNAKVLYVFRGNSRINTFTVLNRAEVGTNGNPGQITIGATGVTAPSVLLCAATTYSAATVSWEGYPSGFTNPAFSTVTNSVSRLCTGVTPISAPTAAYQQQIDMIDYGGGNFMVGFWLQLA